VGQTDEQTASARSLARNNKREGDKYNTALSASQFKQLTSSFNPPVKTEDYVVISGKHTYTTQAKMVLRKLAKPHTQKAESAHKQQMASEPPTRPRPSASRNVIIR